MHWNVQRWTQIISREIILSKKNKKTDFSETLKNYDTSNEWSFNGGKNCFTKELSTVKRLQSGVFRVKEEWLTSGTVPCFFPVNIHSDNICFEDYSEDIKNTIKLKYYKN